MVRWSFVAEFFGSGAAIPPALEGENTVPLSNGLHLE